MSFERRDLEIEDGRLEVLRSEPRIVEQQGEGRFLVVKDDASDAGHGQEFRAVRVGGASGDRDLRGRPPPVDPPDDPGGFGVRRLGHRAGVQDVDVRVFLGPHEFESSPADPLLEGLGFVLVHFAAEGDDGAALHRGTILTAPPLERQL